MCMHCVIEYLLFRSNFPAMAHFERGSDRWTFAKVYNLVTSKDSGRQSNPLSRRIIQDDFSKHLIQLRCALHCIVWIIVRLISNSELRHQRWDHLSWGIQKNNEDIPHKRRCPQLPSVLVDILHLLKKRNPVYDYIVASGIKKEGVPWKNCDALPDFSSYLAVCNTYW